MARKITVGDLKDQIGVQGPHPFLYCDRCEGKYSANKGDYFMSPRDRAFKCCGRNMRLVFERVEYVDAAV